MKKMLVAVLAVALAFTCSTAFAGNNIGRGTKELGIFTGINETESSDSVSSNSSLSDSVNLNLNYGIFLVGGLQVGISLMADQTKSWQEVNGSKVAGSESTNKTTFEFIDVKYNFVFSKSQPVVPFIGIGLGAAQMSNTSAGTTTSNSGSAAKFGVGVKFFLTENTSLNAEISTKSFTFTPEGSNVEYTQDTTGLNVGLSVYF